jgi:Zn-dependent peptidase ImmA (M78 family)/DNA-binding XRE family transcriptional regulator
MDNVFPQRLKELREKFNYSLQDVGEKIGVSRQSIHKFESGELQPSSEKVLQLCNTFGVSYAYFFENPEAFQFDFANIRFRDGEAILQRDHVEEQIKKQVVTYVSRYMQLENLLDLEHSFENPLAGMSISSGKDVEKAARTIRKKWKLGTDPIVDVVDMLEDNGVFVVEINFQEQFLGLSCSLKETLPVVVLNDNCQTKERKRLTALHELAHLVLTFDTRLDNSKIETYCTHFAGAVLLVDEVLFEELGKNRTSISLGELRRIKERYGISIQATILRARNAHFIDYSTYQSWWNKYEQWSHSSSTDQDFGEFLCREKPSKFKDMIVKSLAEKRLTESKAAELLGTKVDLLELELFTFSFNMNS